jgi:hypothetical protein
MAKKKTKTTRRARVAGPDPNQAAHEMFGKIIEKSEAKPDAKKNAAAVALGRLGGLKGGKARAARLTKSQRSAIAKKAAESRWAARDN